MKYNELQQLSAEELAQRQERRLSELAAYHVGLFAGEAARTDRSPAALAHALFLLIEQAERMRKQWLVVADA